MKKYAVIVAGGKGLRMGADVPKQFIPVGKVPVLMRTVNAFRRYDPYIRIILVLPREHQEYWKRLCDEYGFHDKCVVADGGQTRFHSVRNGLSWVDGNDNIVAVHDGVRPFVSADLIGRCFDVAERTGAVIPVTDVVETLRRKEADGTTVTVPRSGYCLVQTPQVFKVGILKQAYSQDYTDGFTDDASVVEASGHRVQLVPGDRTNIKITTPLDLKIAEAILADD